MLLCHGLEWSSGDGCCSLPLREEPCLWIGGEGHRDGSWELPRAVSSSSGSTGNTAADVLFPGEGWHLGVQLAHIEHEGF